MTEHFAGAVVLPGSGGRAWTLAQPASNPASGAEHIRSLDVVELAIPGNEVSHTLCKGRARSEIDGGGEPCNVGVGDRHVSRLHRQQAKVGLAAERRLDHGNEVLQGNGRVVADV